MDTLEQSKLAESVMRGFDRHRSESRRQSSELVHRPLGDIVPHGIDSGGRASQDLCGDPVGQGLLHSESAANEDIQVRGGDRGQLLQKTGLPHPRGTGHGEDEPASADGSAECLLELVQLGLPIDQIGLCLTSSRNLGLDPSRGARGWGKVFVEDCLVELGGLLERGHSEFLVENGHTVAICLDGARPVPGPGVEQHEDAVRRLVKRVELDPLGYGVDRCGVIPGRRQCGPQPVERLADSNAGGFGDTSHPVVEFW